MRIFFISPVGFKTPNLFDSFIPTFIQQGHSIVEDVKDADVVFLDLHSRIGEYDWKVMVQVLNLDLPISFFDFWDYGGCKDETSEWIGKNDWECLKQYSTKDWTHLINLVSVNRNKKIFFVRKMDKTETYQSFVYPIEVCYYKDHDFKPVSKEELFKRPIDITFIGNQSPTRNNVCNGLIDHFKCDFRLGEERIEHEGWLNRHRLSKLFIEACGGGFGSERPQQLFSIALMLRVKSNHLIENDFKHGIDCVEINENPNESDINSIKEIMGNKDWLYSIYLAGIQKMKTYFSEEFRANYILEILKKEGIC